MSGPTLKEMMGLPNPPGCSCRWVDEETPRVRPPDVPADAVCQRYVVCDVCVAIARRREAAERTT